MALNAAVERAERSKFEENIADAMESIRLSDEMFTAHNRQVQQMNANLQTKLEALRAKLHGIQIALRDTEETIDNFERQQYDLIHASSVPEANIDSIKKETEILQEELSGFSHEEDLDIITNPIT
ncbi:hypothetical protein DFQ28_010156 [Apophysomyces sp. BC1034]|nr:hypothetical protein DFQ29_008656 [Apophysomyces sp. BC1021]KAG0184971.1 hypothetical protein DFQ28_010156 [Apophysomyces sp. BC1034]